MVRAWHGCRKAAFNPGSVAAIMGQQYGQIAAYFQAQLNNHRLKPVG
jgi:hypothetical protein